MSVYAIVIGACLIIMVGLFLAPIFKIAFMRFRRMGLFFCLIAAGFLHSMATKPSAPTITWDDYLADDGTYFATNGTTKVGVTFKWRKTDVRLPNTQPLYISKSPTNTTEWTLAATTTVGGSPYTLTLANPETFKFWVWHEWMPPSPVHTNGVWLGTVLETARGTTNRAEKMIVIQGQLIDNGKVIAP